MQGANDDVCKDRELSRPEFYLVGWGITDSNYSSVPNPSLKNSGSLPQNKNLKTSLGILGSRSTNELP
jgi:hypothetical protein